MECCIYALAPHTKHVPLFSICSPPNVFTFAKKYPFAKMYISRSPKPIPWGRPSLISSLCGNRNTHPFFFQNRRNLLFIGLFLTANRPSPRAPFPGTYPHSKSSQPHTPVPAKSPDHAADWSVYRKYRSCDPHHIE